MTSEQVQLLHLAFEVYTCVCVCVSLEDTVNKVSGFGRISAQSFSRHINM